MATYTDIEIFSENLNEKYLVFKEKALKHRRFKHQDIVPLIEKATKSSVFEFKKLGESTEGRSINLLKAGSGKTVVLLWSQMHGDEPTATQALFDIFNFFNDTEHFNAEKEQILSNLTLFFIPMLNPDGAEAFKRRNGLNIDLNRDAARLVTKESKIFKKLRDEILPDFGFNLHDQNPYYTVGESSKPATISFLAPAYNFEKDIDDKRKHSMQVIALMNRVLQKHIPGQVGRYFDAFGPTSMGDHMQKWGTRMMLIESGEYPGDPERQEVRKLNFIAILSALKAMTQGVCAEIDYEEYMKIPEINDAKMFHLLVRNATIEQNGQNFTVDIGVHLNEVNNEDATDFSIQSEVFDIGDLSRFYGYKEIDVNGMLVKSLNSEQIILNLGDQADFILTKDGKTVIEIKNGQVL